ncbi:hypothetical protein HAX54_040719, partial [Datura stramonium]|nr:hypothetical protein [Datura stramonium]
PSFPLRGAKRGVTQLNGPLQEPRDVSPREEDSSARLLYSYHSAMEGFAARFTEAELEFLRESNDVLSICAERRLEIQTTYSYKFLGLSPMREGAC